MPFNPAVIRSIPIITEIIAPTINAVLAKYFILLPILLYIKLPPKFNKIKVRPIKRRTEKCIS